MSKKRRGIGSLIFGATIGVAAGVLLAPKSGKETRQDLKNKIDELVEKIKKIDPAEVREDLSERVEDLREELTNLDKEKVLEIAREKAEDIKAKAAEIVEVAKEKGSEEVANAAEEVRKKALAFTKSIEKKLSK